MTGGMRSLKKYSQMDNAEWVFVSKWLKEFAEEQHRLKFKNSSVINNVINEQRFPYHAKNARTGKRSLLSENLTTAWYIPWI